VITSKSGKTYRPLNPHAPTCREQLACDGKVLGRAAIERGYCDRCKKAMEARAARGGK
jgi:hypothetical protein